MNSFIFSLIFISWSFIFEYPKNITGKWQVENVDVSKIHIPGNLTAQQKTIMEKQLIEPLSNSTFEFKTDGHFYLSANLLGMPKDDFWEYNAAEGKISIKEYKDPKSLIMKIDVVEKGGDLYFALEETGVVLKMKRGE